MDLEKLKLFLRIDDTEEDTLIQSLQIAAEEYLTNAGVKKDYTRELYVTAIKMLIAHWYENRAVEIVGKNIAKIAFGVNLIITQLKYTQGDDI